MAIGKRPKNYPCCKLTYMGRSYYSEKYLTRKENLENCWKQLCIAIADIPRSKNEFLRYSGRIDWYVSA